MKTLTKINSNAQVAILATSFLSIVMVLTIQLGSKQVAIHVSRQYQLYQIRNSKKQTHENSYKNQQNAQVALLATSFLSVVMLLTIQLGSN